MATTIQNEASADVNSIIVDIVISCLEGCSIKQPSGEVKTQYSYLMSQAVRQYKVKNWHISKKAEDLWTTIQSNASIDSYSYKEPFIADRLTHPMTVITYKGATRKKSQEITLVPNGMYVFNEIFISEHVIPISDIIRALHIIYKNNINNPRLKQLITDFLDEKIHIARILRSEDRQIARSSHRISAEDLLSKTGQDCFNQIYTKYYQPASIILK